MGAEPRVPARSRAEYGTPRAKDSKTELLFGPWASWGDPGDFLGHLKLALAYKSDGADAE